MTIEAVLKLTGRQAYALIQGLLVIGFFSALLGSRVFLVSVATVFAAFLVWTLSLCAVLNRRVTANLRMGLRLPFIGLVVAVLSVAALGLLRPGSLPPESEPAAYGLLAFAVFIGIYIPWNCCRLLVAAETETEPPLGRVLGTALVFWLLPVFPVGVYWVQNRARKLHGLAV